MNLTKFTSENLFDATADLFAQLGITLKSNTKNKLELKGLLNEQFKNNDTFKLVDATYFTGIIDESVFGLLNNGYNVEEAIAQGNKNYEGLMMFALQLNKQPTRTQISELTRAFNRVSQKMPVGLLLKYETTTEAAITISLSERFKYKQNWRQGEKAGKVIMLRDIRTQNTHAGHLRILLDLQKHQATTYAQLHAYWLKILDVSILNKQFYQDLFEWYLWAVKNVKFPQIRPDKEDLLDDHVHQSESVIRLLTRLLFCWFMREKNELIKKELFDKDALQNILNDFEGENGKDSTYYRAILQNLFFATLSVPIKERKYIKDTDAFPNKDYGNPYVFRFQDAFVNPKENLKLFKDIPFLNGGLFECLDFVPKPEENNRKETRLDGFSTKKSKQAQVPDFLFWGRHTGIDLSGELDNPRKKNVSIQGIIDLLNNYKFTIEENTPIEEEIALDPELLGKVFENLLASYNPETKTTARKQTGSFYTPREIVDYMVDESLLAYLQTATTLPEETLRQLIGYSEPEIKLSTAERKKIVEAIDTVKILDPACGSGAFPMGVLHKLVWVLKKADPDNKLWLEAVISRLPHTMQEATRKKFENENLDYIRKLGLIQQSIYGIDIQPIATQISKLRFFISLIVDQKIQPHEENYGLLPLPNLDFKLVAANTLIAPTETEQVSTGLFAETESDFERRFKDYTAQYFNVATPKEKTKLRGKIEELIENKVAEKVAQVKKLSSHKDERYSKQVADKNKALIEERKAEAKLWQSYTHLFKHESVGFFETKYFFPEVKNGFDVVIGNPPYVNVENLEENTKKYLFENYNTCKGRTDIYIAFIEKTINLLCSNGIFSYIIPYPFTNQNYGAPARKFLAERHTIKEIVDTSEYNVFENAMVKNIILTVLKQKNDIKTRIKKASSDFDFTNNSFREIQVKQELFLTLKDFRFETRDISSSIILKEKIWENSIYLKEICLIAYGARLNHKTKKISKDFYIHENYKKGYKPFTEGKNINQYTFSQHGWLDYNPEEHYNSMFPELFENEKIIFIRVVKDKLRFAIDNKHFYSSHTVINCVKWNLLENVTHITVRRNITKRNIEIAKKYNYHYLLGVLNSNFINWYFLNFLSDDLNFYPESAKELPVAICDQGKQKTVIKLVDQIIAVKSKNPKADTTLLERKIDELVYKLYELTYDEVKIIDPAFWLSEGEYEKVKN